MFTANAPIFSTIAKETDVSLFAHISLDAEGAGRVRVQGNTFKNTCGYLSQYIKQLQDSNELNSQNYGNLKDFVDGISQLVEYEKQILDVYTSEDLEQLTIKLSQDIAHSKKILIPGGWSNKKGTGHAMIYQFERAESGDLIFSIYNSGAGINFHEKQSTNSQETFFPVKQYKIPQSHGPEFDIFLRNLILAQRPHHSERVDRLDVFDEKKLYQSIEASLAFLNAEPIMVSQNAKYAHITTAGQISGTCSQRSIHQMLKTNFDTLAHYQYFILKFKMYALQDFIKTHPAEYRSPQLNDLIQLAVENNLKILQLPDIFSDPEEKKALTQELMDIKKDLLILKDHKKSVSLHSESTHLNVACEIKITELSNQSNDIHLVENFNSESLEFDVSFNTIEIEAIDELIRQCENLSYDSLSKLEKIEQILLRFPLPNGKDSSAEMPFYAQFEEQNNFKELSQKLMQLHDLYDQISQQTRNGLLPTELITQCNFYALIDYCDKRHAVKNDEPVFQAIGYGMSRFLTHLNNNPFLGTHHPELDERLLQIRQLYELTLVSSDVLSYYKTLIDKEPLLKEQLRRILSPQEYVDAKLESLLQDKGVTELYYLFKQLNADGTLISNSPLQGNLNFKPLLEKIQHAIRLEEFTSNTFKRLLNDQNIQSDKLNLKKSNEELVFDSISTPYVDIQSKASFPTVSNSNYFIKQSYPASVSPSKALFADYSSQFLKDQPPKKIPSNEIQIREADLHTRELFHLRSAPSIQVNQTLEYFSRHLDKLGDLNNQYYMEANLFEPGLLLALLNNDPTFILRFDAFIQKGLQYFIKDNGHLSRESLFFIKLKIQVDCYVAQIAPNQTSKNKLIKDHSWLQLLIEDHKEDMSILGDLHHFDLITEMSLESGDRDIEKILTAYFFTHIQESTLPQSAQERINQMHLERHLKDWLKTLPQEQILIHLKPVLNQILKLNNISSYILSGDFPHFILKNENDSYAIHMNHGSITLNDSFSLSPIPLEIKNHPLLQNLGVHNENTCLMTADGSIEFPKLNLIIKKTADGGLQVQKKWSFEGQTPQWYELRLLTQQQMNYFNQRDLSNDAVQSHLLSKNLSLPTTLTDISFCAWVSLEGNASFITQNHQPLYQINAQSGLVTLHSSSKDDPLILQKDSVYLTNVSSFENPEFVCVHLNTTATEGTVDFPRYGLTLHVSNGQLIDSNTGMELIKPKEQLFQPEVAQLHFQDATHQTCILPVQRFFVDPKVTQETGNFFTLTHDIQNRIVSEETKKDNRQWIYQNSEKSITYHIVNGEPRAENAESALYLCYVYLATHEHKKAWEVLKDLGQRLPLEGTVQELTYLSWIFQDLPHLVQQDETKEAQEEDYNLDSPRETACRLKALSIYTQFLEEGRQPNFSVSKQTDMATANEVYTHQLLENAKQFYQGFNEQIYNTYTRFINMRDHLDMTYHLNDNEYRSLLNRYTSEISGADNYKPKGALGYEWRRLNLKTLLIEKERLTQLVALSPSPAYIKRMNEINKELENELNIMKVSTKLEKAAIDLKLPYSLPYFSSITNVTFSLSTSKDISSALELLTSQIKDEEFLKNLSVYIQLAQEKNKSLEVFCIHYLIANRHIPLEQQTSPMPYLVNALYRAICSDSKPPRNFTGVNDFYEYYRTQEPRVIEIFQAKDVFEKILADSQSIRAELEKTLKVETPISTNPIVQKESRIESLIQSLKATISEEEFNSFEQGLWLFRQSEIKYQNSLNQIAEKDDLPLDEKEQLAGKSQYDATLGKRNAAFNALGLSHIRESLLKKANEYNVVQQTTIEENWAQAIDKANHLLNTVFNTQVIAGQKHLLTSNDLRQCYFNADISFYIEKTGLSAEECQNLHQLIHQCVTSDIEHQQIKRLIHALEQVTPAEQNNATLLAQITEILTYENHPIAKNDPKLMLFQYEENILLRSRQVDAIKNLLSTPKDPHTFNESVEKVIMGGGKSKVILPLLAQKKANGANLVLIEVPQALLATNHADLNSTSQQLFHQTAHRFEFNRDSDCSPKRLEQIHQQLIQTITNKDYLVTTGESIQSLELKYLELLLSPSPKEIKINNNHDHYEKQLFWMGKITELIKQRGDVVIDELHQGLLLKKKLNYTIGAQRAISTELIELSVNFYEFIHTLKTDDLVDALLRHEQSPLKSTIDKLSSVQIEELVDYFNNKRKPDFIDKLPEKDKNVLAYYKEQLHLYPITSARRYKEHYGPSHQNSISALKKALAIPYSANDSPNERSRFGNPMETVNYTIQALLSEGVSYELFKEIVEHWKAQARFEFQREPYRYSSLSETETGQRVADYLKDTQVSSLDNLDPENISQITQLHGQIKSNAHLLFEILKYHILPQINVEPSILHSDAYNHVDLYRSAQGVSGTPWNYQTFHQRLKFNPNTSLGSDSYLKEVLKGKNTPIHAFSMPTQGEKQARLIQFLEGLYQQCAQKNQLHAIIDVSATFVGFSNREVAEALPSICKDRSPDIRYVLYFEKLNGVDVLHAFDIQKKNHILLGSSDPNEINQKLNCGPEHRFTYYDQAHTVGVDLKQPKQGCGLCLVDDKTQMQSFLQGAMRMRGLDQEQTLEIIVPQEMKSQTLDELLEILSQNENTQLQEDIFYSTIAQINNMVRHQALEFIAALPDEDIQTKHQCALIVQDYLIEQQNQNFYELYGEIYQEIETEILLRQYQESSLKKWEVSLTKLLETVNAQAIDAKVTQSKSMIQQEMETLITNALPYCQRYHLSPARPSNHTEVEVQVEKEQEAQKEQQKQMELLRQDSIYPVSYNNTWIERFKQNISTEGPNIKLTLNRGCFEWDESHYIFSDKIKLSYNYTECFSADGSPSANARVLNAYLKPVGPILFMKKNAEIFAYIVTPHEAEELTHILNQDHTIENNSKFWLGNSTGTILAGKAPDHIHEEVNYQIILEQIKFFNGELNELMQQTTPLQWLTTDSNKKMEFFKQSILPYRSTSQVEVNRFQHILEHPFDQYEYILQNATVDLRKENWAKRFPNALTKDINTLQILANAFHEINEIGTYTFKGILPDKAQWVLNTHLRKHSSAEPTLPIDKLYQFLRTAESDDLPDNFNQCRRLILEYNKNAKTEEKIDLSLSNQIKEFSEAIFSLEDNQPIEVNRATFTCEELFKIYEERRLNAQYNEKLSEQKSDVVSVPDTCPIQKQTEMKRALNDARTPAPQDSFPTLGR